MIRKILICLLIFNLASTIPLYAGPDDDEEIKEYKAGFKRATFVSAAVGLGTYLGEGWAVDITSKVITKSIKSGPVLFNIFVASSLKGAALKQALPIASKYGIVIGGVTAAFLAPVIWDCSKGIYRSGIRITNSIMDTQEPTNPEEKKAYLGKATTKDYIASIGTIVGGGVLYSLFFWSSK